MGTLVSLVLRKNTKNVVSDKQLKDAALNIVSLFDEHELTCVSDIRDVILKRWVCEWNLLFTGVPEGVSGVGNHGIRINIHHNIGYPKAEAPDFSYQLEEILGGLFKGLKT